MAPKRRPTQDRRSTKARDAEKGKRGAALLAQQARIRKHEPVDVSTRPSNSFITLHISTIKLQSLGLPVPDRLWKPLNPTWVEKITGPSAVDRSPGAESPPTHDSSSAPSGESGSVGTSETTAAPLKSGQSSKLGRQQHFSGFDPSTAGKSSKPESPDQRRHRGPNFNLQHSVTPAAEMAPVRDPNDVQGSIKDVVQNLFEVQTQVHGFVPETQPLLIEKMSELAQALAHLQKITSPTQSPNNPIHQTRIAPEIIDYVDDGRNPDIFTRDFVEVVQRGNAVINGKQQAFRDFAEIFAAALKEGIEGVEGEVNKVMKNSQRQSAQDGPKEIRENGMSKS